MIYRPGLLQTETVLFSDQEKLLEKVDLRYLKTLKAKKLNTKTLKKKTTLPKSKICDDIQT